VLPRRAVVELDLGHDRPVGVDLVSGMNEEVGRGAPHGLVELHAAPVTIDAPALSRLVARPAEAYGSSAGRRRAQTAADRRAGHPRIGEIDERDAIEHVGAAR